MIFNYFYPPELFENPPPPKDEIEESDELDEDELEKLPPQFHHQPKRKPDDELDEDEEPEPDDEFDDDDEVTSAIKIINKVTSENPAKIASHRVSERSVLDFLNRLFTSLVTADFSRPPRFASVICPAVSSAFARIFLRYSIYSAFFATTYSS